MNPSEEIIKTILRSIQFGMVVVGTDRRIRMVNGAALKMMGFESEDQVVGSVCHNNICPAEVDKCPILDLGMKVDLSEKVLLGRDGMRTPILKTVSVIELEGEDVLLETFVDITERKKAEKEVEATRAFLQSVVDGVAEPIMVFGMDHRVSLMNRAAREFSLGREDVSEGMMCYQVSHHRDTPCSTDSGHPCPLERVRDTGRLVTVVHEHYPPGGERRFFEIMATPLASEDGKPTLIIETSRDITERVRAEGSLKEASEALRERVTELGERNLEINMLSQMGEMLQSCRTVEESYGVVGHASRRLFPTSSGELLVCRASRNVLDAAATWGDIQLDERVVMPDDCWALRRGRMHSVSEFSGDPPCKCAPAGAEAYICVPLLALGDILGVLHLMFGPGDAALAGPRRFEARQRLAQSVAEQVGLSLANLRLRETLRDLSIRDTLTGLFNRRFMDESLERELARAGRKGLPVSVVMFDIDMFKKFNDTYGHGAGDVLLKELGTLIRQHVRRSDVACRYGGEEFALILPEMALDSAVQRAEELREDVKHMQVSHGPTPLGVITVSLGIASFPAHGATPDEVLRASDSALYKAKGSGRDRVCVAGEPPVRVDEDAA